MLRSFLAGLICASALLAVAPFPSAQAADDVLDGWDDYKFGMTIEQVRAVPGIAWGEIQNSEVESGGKVFATFTFLTAAAPVTLGTATYSLRIDFKPNIGLTGIGFEDNQAATSTDACERRFTDALGFLEQRHGAFTARSPVGKTDTPFGTLDMKWRNAPTGKSTYNYLVATMQFEPKGPVHTSIESSVSRKSGNKALVIRAIRPQAGSCTVTINYADLTP